MTHSPSPQAPKSDKQLRLLKRPAVILTILLLLFVLPLLGAFLMAQEKTSLSSHTTNHGQLIQPPLDFAHLDLHHPEGDFVKPDEWKGKWLLLYVNSQPVCNTQCDKKLYDLRQIKTATGKNSQRVERAILTFSDYPLDPHLTILLRTDFVGTSHFIVSKDNFSHLVRTNAQTNLALTGHNIYLVDPLGNIMMMYIEDTEPMGILKDLTRLLKLSYIG